MADPKDPKVKIELTLEKAASGSDGDRYSGEYKGDKLALYFPQSITRPAGSIKPQQSLTIKIEV